MIREIALGGVFLPPLAEPAAIAALVWFALTWALDRARAYRFVWRPALFNTCLYVCVLAVIVASTA
jgi:hypothetical protein